MPRIEDPHYHIAMARKVSWVDEACFWTTKFRVVCPECGRIGSAKWGRELNEVRCLGCGEAFDYRGHTYRPVTGHMTEEERIEYRKYREWQRWYDSTPARRQHNRENAARYYRAHRDEINEKARAKRRENADELRAKARAYYHDHRDEICARRREAYRRKKEGR